MFAKYHYLDHSLHKASRQIIGVYDGQIVAHAGILQFPMRKGWKRVHRLVVLPDYQGVGIGVKFINEVADIISADGFRLNLSTTTPALVGALKRSGKWVLFRKGVIKPSGYKNAQYAKTMKGYDEKGTCFNAINSFLRKSASNKRPTFSFNFKQTDRQ